MMKELRLDYPKCVLGRLLNVSASGYYAWVDRPSSRRAQEEVRLELEIRAAHKRTRQTYGPERLQRDLAEHGVRVGICRIKRIRKKLGIRCRQKRRFKATTLIMLRWRASGPHSSRSWSTTVITEAGRRQLERSRNISSSSITASAARPGWGSCHPRRMSRDSMPDYQQHERFGVHYLRPTSKCCSCTLVDVRSVRPGLVAASREAGKGDLHRNGCTCMATRAGPQAAA